MIFSERDKQKVILLMEGMEEFMLHATKAMLILRGIELLGAGRETISDMWSLTYKEIYEEEISKLSLEDINRILNGEGDAKDE